MMQVLTVPPKAESQAGGGLIALFKAHKGWPVETRNNREKRRGKQQAIARGMCVAQSQGDAFDR